MSDIVYDFDITEEVYHVEIDEELFEVKFDSLLQTTQQISYVCENLNGIVDNNNKLFTTTSNYQLNTTLVYVNGLLQRRGVDYYERGGNVIEFDEAPQNHEFEDEIIIMYIQYGD